MVLTSEQKWQLLGALYQHGTDLQALKEALPDWNTEELSSSIKRYRRRALKRVDERTKHQGVVRTQPQKEWSRVEKWYNLTQQLHRLQGTSDQTKKHGRQRVSYQPRDHSPLLSKVMACIASREDHPLPANPTQPSYTQIYRYLSQLLGGEEPTELDPASAGRVAEAMRQVKQVAEEALELGKYHTHLFQIPQEAFQKRAPKKADLSNDGSGTSRDRVDAEGSDCPLFQDPEDEEGKAEGKEDEEGGSSQDLSPDDPYFEIKREKLIKKVSAEQEKSAAELTKFTRS